MARINPNYAKLQGSYVFPEIGRRAKAFEEKHRVRVFRLGIGDTTQPITPIVLEGLRKGVELLGKEDTYKGYGDEQGDPRLRAAIANFYQERKINIDPSEVFVSDGAKSDLGNLQHIFASNKTRVALQDPVYPAYADTTVMNGNSGVFEDNQYLGITYMPCTPENSFMPNTPDWRIEEVPDLIYLCSPNNPTGAVMNWQSLEKFVSYAGKSKAAIIFDAAYNWFIKDPELPQSIYEIPGALECAIEVNSFSKFAGFPGVRAGWTIVPKQLVVENSQVGDVNARWNRRQTTFFNGASRISQEGGLAALTHEGREECQRLLIDHYMENAQIIKAGLESRGIIVYGGVNAPYLWMENPNKMPSWDFFDKMLEEAHVVTTPGVAFGPSGEGYTRLSAFGTRENVEKAVKSITENLRL